MDGMNTSAHIPLPSKVKVEITTRCNLRCPQCKRTQVRPMLRDISIDTFVRIREQLLPHARSVFFSGLGEPTLHPQFAEICREIDLVKRDNKKLYAFFVTNGTNLTPEVRTHILEAGFDEILVSLDATSSHTYTKVRPGADFQLVLENLRQISSARRVSERPLRITLTYTLNRVNSLEARDLPKTAFDLDCDGIVLQNMMVHSREAVPDLLLNEDREALSIAEETIQYVANGALERGLSCKVPAPGWIDAILHAENHSEGWPAGKPPRRCTRPWEVIQLRLNGSISSCIGTEFLRVDPADVVDIRKEIWESDAFQAVRNGITEGRAEPWCTRCSVLNQIPMSDAHERLGRSSEST